MEERKIETFIYEDFGKLFNEISPEILSQKLNRESIEPMKIEASA